MKAFAKRMADIIPSASIAMAQLAGTVVKGREVIDLRHGGNWISIHRNI